MKKFLVFSSIVVLSYLMTVTIATIGEVTHFNNCTNSEHLSVSEELYNTILNPLGEW